MAKMANPIQFIYKYYKLVNDDWADPRTKDWFLVWSPFYTFTIIGVYIHFVHVLGPALMAKRKPYNLKKVIVVYNIMQIFLNAYIATQACRYAWFWKYKFICEPVNYSTTPDTMQMVTAVWVFYMIKLFDLLDTIFFILRKKHNQVTFLHVYHHAGMIIVGWIATKYLPGGHGTFIGFVNSCVHVIMYTHYLSTSLKLGKPWWKKYITQVQLFQFYIVLIHCLLGLLAKDCAYPKWPLAIFMPQNFFMLVLFSDFYYRNYLKQKSEMTDKNDVPITTESKQTNVELPNGKSKTH